MIILQLDSEQLSNLVQSSIRKVLNETPPDTPEANAQSSELLTIEQVSEYLHLSKATIYSKCSRNELPYMKRGKRLYFLREQLLEYVKAGRCETAQELAENAHEYLTKKKGGQRNG